MALEKFHFEHDGKSYEMPLMNQLKQGQKLDLGEAFENSAERGHVLIATIVKIAGDAGEAIKDMYDAEFSELLSAWVEASKATSGK